MAVIIMPLLPAVAAGIAFTCDRVMAAKDRMLIHATEAGRGAGGR
ncbi:MAG: hypothetical protein U1E47_01275 [Rivihabitans pingtungensis]